MNWDAIGAAGEVLGALAVVVSIVYLGRQVKHGVNSIENDAYSENASTFRAVLGLTGQYNDQFIHGLKHFDSMSPGDRWKFAIVMNGQLSNFESFFYKQKRQYIDEEHGERWKRIIIWYLSWPGVALWWEQFSIAYTDTFQDYVNELLKGLADGSIPKPDQTGFDVDNM